MNPPFISDMHFKGEDYSQIRLEKAAYEECTFMGCNFAEGDLANQIAMPYL